MNVSSATAGERDASLRLLAGPWPADICDRFVERRRQLFASGELDPAGLFAARGPDGLVGAMLVIVMPGALGLASPPVALRHNRAAIEDSLVAAACAWLRSRGVKVCQGFGEIEEEFAPLVRSGFRRLTRILQLDHTLDDDPPPIRQLTFEPFSEANRDLFFRMLSASFEGSLDCPELNGTRTEAELLAAYDDMATAGWHLAKRGAEPVGVLLLNDPPEPRRITLSYLGLAPEFRGLGLGAELVSYALRSARDTGCSTLVLSVDERNGPARKLYETLGFQASGARSVFLADWPALS